MRIGRSGTALLWLVGICLLVGVQTPAAAAQRKASAAVASNCVALLGNRQLFGETTISYRGNCPTGFAEGARKVAGRSGKPGQNDTFEIDSTFVHGRPSGTTTIRQSNGLTFVGDIASNGDSFGTTTLPNGDVLIGEGREGLVWRATLNSRSGPAATKYFLRGSEVPQQLYASDLQGQPPPEAIFKPAIAPTCANPSFDRRKRALCDGQPAAGLRSVSFRTVDGKAAVVVAEFANGVSAGPGRIDVVGERLFIGILAKSERSEGITRLSDGGVERGTYKSDRLYDGTLTTLRSNGAEITATFQRGKLVDLSQAPARLSGSVQAGDHLARMTKVRIGGDLCLADLPSTEFKIQADLSGGCRGYYYTGNATLTLTPLQPGLPRQVIKLGYQDGLTGGTAVLSLPGGQSFRGTLSNWRPETGQMSRPLGNDNYEIVLYSRGRATGRQIEHREPTEAELAARQIVSALLQSAIRCAAGQCPGDRQATAGPSSRGGGGGERIAQADTSDRAAQQERDRITAANCGYAYSRTVDPRYCAPKFDAEGADRANAEASRRYHDQVQAEVQASDAVWQQRIAQQEAAQRAARDEEQRRLRQEQAASEQAEAQHAATDRAAQQERDRITAANCGYAYSRTVDPRYCAPKFDAEGADRANAEASRRYHDQVQAEVQASDAVWQQRIAQQEAAQRAARDEEQRRLRQEQAASEQARVQQAAADRTAQQERDRITAANCGYAYSRTVDPRFCSPPSSAEARSTPQPSSLSQTTSAARSPPGRDATPGGATSTLIATASGSAATSKVGNPLPTASDHGLSAHDRLWADALVPQLRTQIQSLSADQIDELRRTGRWEELKTAFTQSSTAIRSADVAGAQEQIAIWEKAWGQTKTTIIVGGTALVPVGGLFTAVNDMRAVGTATQGIARSAELGQAGEEAVRAAYNIGSKITIRVGERIRIPDGLTATTLTEVKNVAQLNLTTQLRDYMAFAQETNRTFVLFVRKGAILSKPLQEAISSGQIILKFIP